MSKALKTVFAAHAIVAVIFGLPLLIAPGRLLTWVGWAPIDPILSRVLGAALLALGWSSFRARQAASYREVRLLIELEAAFTGLACVGLLRHLLVARWPLFPWLVFALYLVFALAWIYFLVRRE